jgi:excisionase family DNA binding protein
MEKAAARRRELTLHEAAERIGKHYITTLKLARSGKLRAIKKGGQWYVTEEEVERFNREGNYKGDD